MLARLKKLWRSGIAPTIAAILILFLIIGIATIIMTLLKPEYVVATVIALGAFFVIIAIIAGPSLAKAAMRGGGK